MAQKGAYQNDKRVGKWTYWYPNGKIKQILIYTNNDFEVQAYFDKTGTQKVKNGTGKWQTFAYNRIREKTLLKAYFKQGKKQGTWEYYQPDYLKKPLFKEKYAQGVLKKTIAGLMTPVSKFNRYDLAQLKFEYTEAFKSDYKVKRRADGSIQYKLFINNEKNLLQNIKKPTQPAKHANPFAHIPTDMSDVKIYTKVSQKAYLIKKTGVVQPSIRYPTQARRQGIQGVVVVEFVVEKNGKTSMIQVSKGIGGGCDQEAIRVVKLAKYHPAINNGKRVRMRMSIPLSFKLD
jgi:TonB family protein